MQRGTWPRNPTIYQIYPRSFQDTTGSGEGDLSGITRRLDHVATLGVDAIWLSPFFTSPMDDGGYDVADHRAINPRFGTMDDFEALVARAHDLGLRVVIDQVFNHTSITHPWFQKSLSGDPDYRDYYIWADAKPDGGPPSNWIGVFGDPAWQWHHQRRQYCLHQFLPSQPSVNLRNPDVLVEHRKTLEFWRARGVDGFRFDAVTAFIHDETFRDNPPADAQTRANATAGASNPYSYQAHIYDMMPRDCAELTEDLRKWVGADAYLIGEITQGNNAVELARTVATPKALDAAYTVDLANHGVTGNVLADLIARGAGQGNFAWWLSSHDEQRHVSRAGDGSAHDARMFAALLLALPGPVLLFQGEEVGQLQSDLAEGDLVDPFDKAFWPDPPGRDGARAPFPWDTTQKSCGFTTGVPWLPVAQTADGCVVDQAGRADSVLRLYREALTLRRKLNLADARIEVIKAEENWFHAHLTPETGARVDICVNLGAEACDIPSVLQGTSPTLASTTLDGNTMPPRSAIWVRQAS